MGEVILAAGKLGHKMPAEFARFQMERSEPMGAYRSSSQIDFENGRAVEVEAIWGEPYRQAKRVGADVRRLEMLYFLLKKVTACEA